MAWSELSMLGTFNAAADALGVEHLGVAWGVAQVPFASVEEREKFLNALVMMPRTQPGNSLLKQSQAPLQFAQGV